MIKRKELRYYGINTCLAIWKCRRKDIIRIYITEENLKLFSEVLSWCASNKIAYHVVTNSDIEKYSRAVHHEGVCVLAKEIIELGYEDFEKEIKSLSTNNCIIYLDGVSNPHNLGGILRTAAHFGIKYVLGSKNQLPTLSPSLCRVSQGTSEYVSLIRATKPVKSLNSLKSLGYTIISMTTDTKNSLYSYKFTTPCIICLGSEGGGVSRDVLSLSDDKLSIPGTGEVQSLNVSCATSIVLSEFWRQLSCLK